MKNHFLFASLLLTSVSLHAQDTVSVRAMFVQKRDLAVMVQPGKGSWDDGPKHGSFTPGDSVQVYMNKQLPRLHDSVLDPLLDRYWFVRYPAYPPSLEAGTGWVLKAGLTNDRTLAWANRPLESVNMFVRPKQLAVLDKPSPESPVRGSLNNGTLVKVVRKLGQKQGAWVCVNYFNGPGEPLLMGWVARKNLVSTRDSIEHFAAPRYRPVTESPAMRK